MTDSRCRDCHVETLPITDDRAEYYMVHNHLWRAAGMRHGFLCVGCLEARLGRTLYAADFTAAPLNDPAAPETPRYAWSYRTARLRDRLTAASSWPLGTQLRPLAGQLALW